MNENITKLNLIISDCKVIHNKQLNQSGKEFMYLTSLSEGNFLSIHKRVLALIPKFGYSEEDINKLFTHRRSSDTEFDTLYIKNYINFLESIRDNPLPEKKEQVIFGVTELLEKIFKNFHRCCRQLLIRHAQKETLKIENEYDVQDLLHAILKLHFDDVRAEVSTPQYAGRNSRIDFILNEHDIAIEVKKTRDNLKEKEIGDELLIDIARYQQSYPKIKLLICFVYDPEELIINPIGLENNLNDTPSNIPIKTIICPKH